ncbi:MAG: hypothetical protein A4E61_00742 [Syntrophorhabdus sp. PtaB.Bin184]|nr:MAG: hypothetical protein A4E61_00742 [Syntrophorhabdus sp. PtaB.Bin184]
MDYDGECGAVLPDGGVLVTRGRFPPGYLFEVLSHGWKIFRYKEGEGIDAPGEVLFVISEHLEGLPVGKGDPSILVHLEDDLGNGFCEVPEPSFPFPELPVGLFQLRGVDKNAAQARQFTLAEDGGGIDNGGKGGAVLFLHHVFIARDLSLPGNDPCNVLANPLLFIPGEKVHPQHGAAGEVLLGVTEKLEPPPVGVGDDTIWVLLEDDLRGELRDVAELPLLFLQPFLGLLPFRYVDDDAAPTGESPAFHNPGDVGYDGEGGAVLPDGGELRFPRRCALGYCLKGLPDPGEVGGVDKVEGHKALLDVAGGVSVDVVGLSVDKGHHAVGIHLEDDLGNELGDIAEAALAFPEVLLGPFSLGDLSLQVRKGDAAWPSFVPGDDKGSCRSASLPGLVKEPPEEQGLFGVEFLFPDGLLHRGYDTGERGWA